MKRIALTLAVLFALVPSFAAESKKKAGPSLTEQLDQAGKRVEELAKEAPKEVDKHAKSVDKQAKGVGDRLSELFSSGKKQVSQAWDSFMQTMRRWFGKK